ncbi:MAG TPA: TIGR02300 family protein [Acetobacteraceae bacterium]|nr:TIGR02300 family protein [Acetobacteraceae bacterium]
MGRPELGTKCTCAGCNERFYDLNRDPAICPKCGAQQPPQKARTAWPSRGTAGPRRPYRAPDPVAADEDAAPTIAADDADEEDEAVADSDDDDDVENVIDPDHDATPD